MANGDDIWGAITGLRGDIRTLMVDGCAQRKADIVRLEVVEDATKDHGKKLDKIYYTSLVTAGGIIAFLIKAFLPYFIR